MADLKASGARITVEVKHNFGRPNEDLLQYLTGLEDRLKRKVIRKMVGAAGTELAKEIRQQLKKRDMLNRTPPLILKDLTLPKN